MAKSIVSDKQARYERGDGRLEAPSGSGYLLSGNNLSDIGAPATALANLGGAAYTGMSLAGLGLGILTLNPYSCNASAALTAEDVFFTLVTATASRSISTLGTWLFTAGATTGSGVNVLGLYSEAGSLLEQTGDMTTAFESTGFAEGSITPYSLVAGTNYYLAITANFTGTTAHCAGRSTTLPPSNLNGHYLTGYLASQATLPGTITPSSLSATGSSCFIYGR